VCSEYSSVVRVDGAVNSCIPSREVPIGCIVPCVLQLQYSRVLLTCCSALRPVVHRCMHVALATTDSVVVIAAAILAVVSMTHA
jgi:hypothetical protein